MIQEEAAFEKTVPSWIWHAQGIDQLEYTLTKKFHLSIDTANLSFFIALTGSVIIELNGVEIGRLDEDAQYLTTFTKFKSFPNRLKAGDHELKLRVACVHPMPVEPVSIHLIHRRVGLIAYLIDEDGLWLPTDHTWKAWADGDATEQPAAIICRLGEEPYGDLENGLEWFVRGGFGDIVTEKLTDVGLISSKNAHCSIADSELLIQGTHTTLTSYERSPATERHIFYHLLKQTEWKKLRTYQNQLDLTAAPQVRIDLKKEYNARFKATNLAASSVVIWWNGAESLFELDGYDGCITETFQVDPGHSFVIQPQGLRFLQLFVLSSNSLAVGRDAINLSVQFESAGVALTQVGTYSGDLPLLNQIYDVAVHTNRVCHQLGLWDGIKRDRLNWAYDFYMAGKADYVLWDNLDVLKRSIVELGKTPYGYWMNGIPAYTLWWIHNLWEYYWYTGDKQFLIEHQEDLLRHVQWMKENLTPDGYLKKRFMTLIEWVPMNEDEQWVCMHGLLAIAAQSLHSLRQYVPELGIAAVWPKARMQEEDFLKSPSLVTPLIGIAAGYVDADHAREFLNSYQLSDPITPLSAFWLAECYSQFGMHEQAWETVSQVWGCQIKDDATTFWESVVLSPQSDFHDSQTTYTAYSSYRMSLCHSWASTPVQWVSRFILGVEPLEPGYAKIKYSPNAITGLTGCKGTVGTPFGAVKVEWQLEDGNLVSKLDAPSGIVVEK